MLIVMLASTLLMGLSWLL
ncbi:hypothetical protein M3685_06685 [Heyndrickxia oleronia]|nr:hypothetical protein [Heyndrickxia oleronia]MCI1762314.1 hypothetical protein [Heyndrickxia oleronia]MCM3453623.1 hypothetical protein [Heyndrickxia oleronia]